MKKKFFLSLIFIFSLSVNVPAESYLSAGLSLEGAFVPMTSFGEKCVPIRPSFYLACDTFSKSDFIGFHVDSNILPIGWGNDDNDDEDNKNNDTVMFGISLSVLIGPVFNFSDTIYFVPGVSAGFAFFASENSTFGDAYCGVGLNTYAVLAKELTLGFTADYYPLYHYETTNKKTNKKKTTEGESACLVRFGIYFAFKI